MYRSFVSSKASGFLRGLRDRIESRTERKGVASETGGSEKRE
jgi:hypothetical protein